MGGSTDCRLPHSRAPGSNFYRGRYRHCRSHSRSLPTRTATVPRKLRHLSHRFTAPSIANRNLAQVVARPRTLRTNHQTASRPAPPPSVELPANFFASPTQRRRPPLPSRQLSLFQSFAPQSQAAATSKSQQLRYLSPRCISIQFPQAYPGVGKLSVVKIKFDRGKEADSRPHYSGSHKSEVYPVWPRRPRRPIPDSTSYQSTERLYKPVNISL